MLLSSGTSKEVTQINQRCSTSQALRQLVCLTLAGRRLTFQLRCIPDGPGSTIRYNTMDVAEMTFSILSIT